MLSKDLALGRDRVGITSPRSVVERLMRHVKWTIERYADDAAFKAKRAYDVTSFEGNIMLNEGIDEIWLLVTGTGSPTNYGNASARLGVGDDATAESATQTGLIAATNKLFKAMNGGFPTTGTQKVTFKSDFVSGDANYLWTEFTVDNGSTPDKNLNRKVSAQGTKTSGQTWVLTLDITLS